MHGYVESVGRVMVDLRTSTKVRRQGCELHNGAAGGTPLNVIIRRPTNTLLTRRHLDHGCRRAVRAAHARCRPKARTRLSCPTYLGGSRAGKCRGRGTPPPSWSTAEAHPTPNRSSSAAGQARTGSTTRAQQRQATHQHHHHHHHQHDDDDDDDDDDDGDDMTMMMMIIIM
jgi:hypothetical protein